MTDYIALFDMELLYLKKKLYICTAITSGTRLCQKNNGLIFESFGTSKASKIKPFLFI